MKQESKGAKIGLKGAEIEEKGDKVGPKGAEDETKGELVVHKGDEKKNIVFASNFYDNIFLIVLLQFATALQNSAETDEFHATSQEPEENNVKDYFNAQQNILFKSFKKQRVGILIPTDAAASKMVVPFSTFTS